MAKVKKFLIKAKFLQQNIIFYAKIIKFVIFY